MKQPQDFVVAIDFDGTIVEDNYPEIGKLLPQAKESIQEIKELGTTIVIWTCRMDDKAEQAKEFLTKNEIPFDYFNENTDERKRFYGNDSRKISADIYIDDRGAGWCDVQCTASENNVDIWDVLMDDIKWEMNKNIMSAARKEGVKDSVL